MFQRLAGDRGAVALPEDRRTEPPLEPLLGVLRYGVLASRSGAAGVAPTTTMLGVTRLAIPGQMVELEGTAVA